MSIVPWGEQEATGCQSSGFYFFLHLLFLCLFSMLQPVQFIMWGQLSVVIPVPFIIHPQKGQIQHYAKAELSSVFAFPALTLSLSLVIENTMFLLFRDVPYWVLWLNVSWQLSTMQPLAHQDFGCQGPSWLTPLLVSLFSSTRFCCAFLEVTSLAQGNVSTQMAAMRNWRS